MAGTAHKKTEMNRAAIYARVSDKSQAEEDKTSISEQIAEMEDHCERGGLTIVARYQEVGRGWTKNRPEFQRMLADAGLGRFDTIVCWKSDRLSRGMYPAAALMEVVEAYQINLEAVMDAIDIKTFGLMAAIGKIEIDNFRERAAMGKRGSAKQGRIPVGAVPYGYRRGDDGRPVVVAAEAETVRRIFGLCVDGLGTRKIADRLNAESGRWHYSHINRILTNETYAGTWWYGKTKHRQTEAGRQVVARGRDSWVGVPFPPVVDRETWDRAQAAMKRRRATARRNTRTFYLLQHMVKCSECGRLMGARTYSGSGRRGPLRYYRCYGFRNGCRPRSMIRAERLEDLIWNEVSRVLEDPAIIVAGVTSLDGQEDGGLDDEIAGAERDLTKVLEEEDRAIRLYVSGKITEDQLDHQRRFITERLEALRERLEGYRALRSARSASAALGRRVVAWAEEIGDRLEDLSDRERRELLRLLLDRATIDGDNSLILTLAVPVEGEYVIAPPGRRCEALPISPDDRPRPPAWGS